MYTQMGPPPVSTIRQANAQASTIFLAKVFNWMAIGLGLTGLTAFFTANSQVMQQLIFGNKIIFYGLMFAEIGMVIYLSARLQHMTSQAATGIFLVYSALNGITLSAILLIYTMSSVAATFFITAGMFGSMAVYGMVTKRDLTGMGSFMFMGLIGMVIASVVNIFLGSPAISWAVSGIGVIVFTGLTAYDVQKITQMGAAGIMEQGAGAIQKVAIMGALTLYLDFINLFLSLLQFFGNRRD